MRSTLCNLLRRLWQDDDGSVIATEYLILGAIVALGSVSGLAAMRDATVSEMEEHANAVRAVRQTYQYSGQQSPLASRAGSAAVDSGTCRVAPGATASATAVRAQDVLRFAP
jgi:hypothetical protein